MQLIRIIVPSLLAFTTVWAQAAAPRPGPGAEAFRPAPTDGTKRRSELKAVLRRSGEQTMGGNAALDESQRQQLRRQLREQSSQ